MTSSVTWRLTTSGVVIIKRRNYDETGTQTRSERGNLAKLRRCQFGNLIRYQFGPQQSSIATCFARSRMKHPLPVNVWPCLWDPGA
jgi:hypothetical protein